MHSPSKESTTSDSAVFRKCFAITYVSTPIEVPDLVYALTLDRHPSFLAVSGKRQVRNSQL